MSSREDGKEGAKFLETVTWRSRKVTMRIDDAVNGYPSRDFTTDIEDILVQILALSPSEKLIGTRQVAPKSTSCFYCLGVCSDGAQVCRSEHKRIEVKARTYYICP